MHWQSDQLKEMFVLLSDPPLCCIQYRLVHNTREGDYHHARPEF